LQLLLKFAIWTPRISFKINILLAGVLLWKRDLHEVLKSVNMLVDKYGTKFPPKHFIWKNQRICRYYGGVLYSSALFAYNYRTSHPEVVFKTPSWATVSVFFMDAAENGIKMNKKMLMQLTHSHLYWAEELKNKKDNDGVLSAVKNILRAHGIDSADIFITNFLVNLESYLLHKKSGSEVLDKFKIDIEVHNPIYSSETWMCLYNILIFNGLLQSGFVARNKAIDQVFAEAESEPENPVYNERALFAAFEIADFSLAKKLLKRLEKIILLKKYQDLQAYFFLLTGDINNARKLWEKSLTKSDKIFADYFRNKKVAIVGPAPTGLSTGSEIDSCDIVIRMNYMGGDVRLSQNEFGAKTNVTLYAATFLKMKKEQPKQFVKDLDYYFVKHPFSGFVNIDVKQRKAKVLIKNKMFFNKKPNAIPCIVYDILHYETSKIKIFHSNFFLSEKPYHKNYPGIILDEKTPKFPNALPLLTYHDLISQISFIRNLWKMGLIEVDENCADILSMSNDKYMEGMEKLF
jgi:hypothetical protein